MSIRSSYFFQSFSIIILISTVIMPFGVYAQEKEGEINPIAVMQIAQRDARNNVDGGIWMLGGCCLGWVGLGAAYVIEPSIPMANLVGKSPEYVAIYVDTYKSEAKRIQGSKAMTGCIVSTLAGAIGYVMLIAAAASSTSSY